MQEMVLEDSTLVMRKVQQLLVDIGGVLVVGDIVGGGLVHFHNIFGGGLIGIGFGIQQMIQCYFQ